MTSSSRSGGHDSSTTSGNSDSDIHVSHKKAVLSSARNYSTAVDMALARLILDVL